MQEKSLSEISANIDALDKCPKTVSFKEHKAKLTLGQSTNAEVAADWLTWVRHVFMISLCVVLCNLCILCVACCDINILCVLTDNYVTFTK